MSRRGFLKTAAAVM
ncbi:MAG: twin-arginine translocation signal domain-containing protein [Bacteroidales bacterium]|nr:twin-arginine translocation signal domain-containing protein [Bacteroidales bacterium]